MNPLLTPLRTGDLDGMGRFFIQFTADPEKAEEAAKIAKQTALDMVEKTPPTEKEIASVKAQIQNILDTQLKQPRFWSSTLSSMLTEGRTLDAIKSIENDYASITKEQIATVLKKYLDHMRGGGDTTLTTRD